MSTPEVNSKPVNTIASDIVLDTKAMVDFFYGFVPKVLLSGAIGIVLGLIVWFFLQARFDGTAFVEVTSTPLRDVIGANEAPDQMAILLKTVEAESVSAPILTTVREQLEKEGISVSLKFKAKNLVGTRLIRLRVRAESKDFAIRAANTWAQVLVDSFNARRVEWAKTNGSLLTTHYDSSVKEILGLELKIRQLKEDMEIQKTELDAVEKQLFKSMEELVNIGPEIRALDASLPILKEEIKNTPPVLPQPAEKGEQYVFMNTINATEKTIGVIAYGTNPLFLELSKKISDTEVGKEIKKQRETQLKEMIREGNKRRDSLRGQLNRSFLVLSDLEQKLTYTKGVFGLFSDRIGQTVLSSSLPTSNVRVAHFATKAEQVSFFYQCLIIGGTIGIFLFPIFLTKI